MFQESNVTVMVGDFERAVHFYTDTLGLPLKSRFGDDWAEVQAPGLVIALHPAGEHGPKPGQMGGMSIGLQVDDMDSAVATLKGRGVTFRGPIIDNDFVRLANFGDADGNPLYLAQTTPAGRGS